MRLNQVKAGVIVNYITVALGVVVSLIYTPFMIDQMGLGEYGLYTTALAVVSNLSLLNMGMNSTYTRFYSRMKHEGDEEGVRRLNGMVLTIYCAMAVLALIIGGFLALNSQTVFGDKLTEAEMAKMPALVMILVVNVAVTLPSGLFESMIVVNERFLFLRSLNILKTVLNPAITVPVLLLGFRSIGMAVCACIIHVVYLLCCIIYCHKKLKAKITLNSFQKTLLKSLLGFTFYVFMGVLVNQLNWSVDKYILTLLHGTVATGVYGLADQLNMYFITLSNIISQGLIPRVHRIVATTNDNGELTRLFTRVGRLQFMLLMLIWMGVFAFGRFFVSIWANGQDVTAADYNEIYWIAILLMGSNIMPSIQVLGTEIQRAKNMHKFRAWLYLGVCAANIIISIPLSVLWRGFGAAVGTAITVLVGPGLIMNSYYKRKIGLDIGFFWREMVRLLPAMIPNALVCVALCVWFPIRSVMSFLLCGVAFVVLYAVCMWRFGMNQSEKDMIRRPLQKITAKLKKKA